MLVRNFRHIYVYTYMYGYSKLHASLLLLYTYPADLDYNCRNFYLLEKTLNKVAANDPHKIKSNSRKKVTTAE